MCSSDLILEGLYAHKRIGRTEDSGFVAGERRRQEPPEENLRKAKRQFQ